MKWQPLACDITGKLRENGLLNFKTAETVMNLIQKGDTAAAFRKVFLTVRSKGLITGWNKIWRKGNLYAWYGKLVTVLPLRAAVLEWRWLSSNKVLTLDDGDADADGEDNSRLTNYGLSLNAVKTGRPEELRKFIQRANLDQRELPFIERWSWSGDVGTAILSDEGRFQVNRALVWTRAIEFGLSQSLIMSESIMHFLKSVLPDERESELPGEIDSDLVSCLNCLEFYGFAQRLGSRVRYRRSPGGFPALALELWEVN